MTDISRQVAEHFGPSDDRIVAAAVATVREAGPTPDKIKDVPEFVRRWCHLIRLHDPRLLDLSDTEIRNGILSPLTAQRDSAHKPPTN